MNYFASAFYGLARAFVCLGITASLCGCSTLQGYPNDAISELPDNSDSTFLFSDSEYTAIKDTVTRNARVQKKLRDIDLAYAQFESSLYKENVTTDLATDVTLLALAGGTVLTGSSAEKELLATISAFILGSKSAYDKRALLENSMSVIVQKMRADRAVVRNDILRGRGQELKYYSADNAALDLARYYYAGTIPGALAGLAKVAIDEEIAAKKEEKKIVSEQFMIDSATQCLVSYWKPGNTLNTTHQAEIKSWLDASKYKDIPFALFMYSPKGAQGRVDAVNALIEQGKINQCDF